MVLEFTRAGVRGTVDARLDLVYDPLAFGKPAGTEGFPCCRASVDYRGRGYDALFGWVQLVRSTDAGTEFAIDPLRFFENASAPHCFYGFCPQLFDAPSRDERVPMDWVAHSFLAPIELFTGRREVRPATGFSWGFEINRTGAIVVRPIHPLSPADWEQHCEYLSRTFPEWSFLAAEMSDAHLGQRRHDGLDP